MSYHERKNLYNILMTVVITLVYGLVIINRYNAGAFDTSNMLRVWAIIILIYIPISVVGRIILMIIYRILGEIKDEIKGEKETDRDIVDERDKLIELKANYISQFVFAIGFILSLVTLLFDFGVSVFFIVLLSGGVISDILSNIIQIIYYRRGI
jgi:hypothetical protein